MDVLRSIKVGTLKDATEIAQILHGQVSIDLPSVAASFAIASASAVAAGLTSLHRVVLMPTSWLASSAVDIKAAIGIDGGIQVTAMNSSASAVDMGAVTYNFFAWR